MILKGLYYINFIFAYSNESKDFNIELQAHEGMNTLCFDLNNGSIEGKNYTNSGIIPNKGTMELKKVDSLHNPLCDFCFTIEFCLFYKA